MDAPVPASALIHSATLVSAGVYLILRFFDLLQLSGLIPLISILGALTAAYGGLVAGMQTDLKRALAYSTISHCGFLFTFTALGGSSAALLYLFLHGFFKALSFICAGEFIRMSAGYQDLNRMGGAFFLTPSLVSQFVIAMGNLCGLPFFIGYYFKNSFQNHVLSAGGFSSAIELLITVGLLCSLLYFFKVFYCVSFSFKKTNYKNLQEFLKQNLKYSGYFIKNPKIVAIIFWFLLGATLLCVFLYFKHLDGVLVCHVTDTQTASMSLAISEKTLNPLKYSKINYLFVFYTFFFFTVVILLISYSPRRLGGSFLITNLMYGVVVPVLTYINLLI